MFWFETNNLFQNYPQQDWQSELKLKNETVVGHEVPNLLVRSDVYAMQTFTAQTLCCQGSDNFTVDSRWIWHDIEKVDYHVFFKTLR